MTAGEMRQALEVFGDLSIDQDIGGSLTAGNPGADEVNGDLGTIEIRGQWRAIEQVLSHKASGGDGGLSCRMRCRACSIVSQSRSCHAPTRLRASCVALGGMMASACPSSAK